MEKHPEWQPNDFEKVLTLGTGTFGRVFLVTHKETGNYYAMKVLPKSVIARLKQVQHVFNEKKALQAISSCPFAVDLEQTMKDAKNIYFILEYVLGGELFTHLREAETFSGPTTRFYAAEMVLAIEFMHKKNIVYRDLKPENVLLDKRGHIRITDFGFAKEIKDQTFSLCGTPEYLAPELIRGKGYSFAVDWWALGILIFEMLAGFPPFFDENPFGVYEKILLGRLVFPNEFDSASRDLLKKLLAIDTSKRLGNLKGGSADIKKHRFFKDIEWDALIAKKTVAPIIPKVDHEGDAVNFQNYEEEEGFDFCIDPLATDCYYSQFESF